jgi:hypothetical protein
MPLRDFALGAIVGFAILFYSLPALADKVGVASATMVLEILEIGSPAPHSSLAGRRT